MINIKTGLFKQKKILTDPLNTVTTNMQTFKEHLDFKSSYFEVKFGDFC